MSKPKDFYEKLKDVISNEETFNRVISLICEYKLTSFEKKELKKSKYK